MDTQLRLLSNDDIPRDWRLDDDTRLTGLRGIALARQALADARRHRADDEPSAA